MSKLAGVNATLASKTEQLIKLAAAEGITIIITQGLRTIAEQNALYAQGRTKPGSIVTNAKGGTSYHNYGLAVDFAVVEKNGKINWTVDKRWLRVGALGKTLGLEWGGDWKGFVDYPHFQLTFGLSIKDLQAGKRPGKATAAAAPAKVVAGVSTVKYPGKVIEVGSKGKDVERIQRAVGVTPDGIFGKGTEAAVKAYQKRKKLAVDGKVGAKTWAMMF